MHRLVVCVFVATTLAWSSHQALAQCTERSTDPCCIASNGNIQVSRSTSYPIVVTSFQQIRACLNSLPPLPANLRSELISALNSKFTHLYSFLDLARNSNDSTPCSTRYNHYNLSYDGLSALSATQSETSVVGYYQALSKVFRRFNDAHTRFFSPLQGFHYVPPVLLSIRYNNLNRRLEAYIAKINPLYTFINGSRLTDSDPYRVKWQNFLGMRVVEVNNIEVFTYFNMRADNMGFHKNRGVRLNQFLKQVYFSMGEHDFPVSDYENYKLENGAELRGLLVGVISDPRLTGSGQQFLYNFTTNRENTVISDIKLSTLLELGLEYDTARRLTAQASNSWSLRPLKSITIENFIVAFQMNNSIIIKMPGEFGISPRVATFLFDMQRVFRGAIEMARNNRKIDTILFDVIGNNGGQVLLTNWLLGAMVKEYRNSDSKRCVTYDFKVSSVWNKWISLFAGQPWSGRVDSLTDGQVDDVLDQLITRETEFRELFDLDLSSLYRTVVTPELLIPLRNALGRNGNNRTALNAEVKSTLKTFLVRSFGMDFRYTEWYPMTQRNQTDGSSYSDLSYYRSSVNYLRGGVNGRYTKRFYESCFTSFSAAEKANVWGSINYFFKNIIFLTDGTCGGACGHLLSKLQVDGKARVATFGGVPGEPMDTSFTGGYIEDWPEEFEKIRLSELLGQIVFQANSSFPQVDKLPVPATYTITAFELYMSGLGQCALPREWYNIPGDHYIRQWATQLDDWPTPDYVQLQALYNDTIAALAPPQVDDDSGLSGGALTAVLIVGIMAAVVLAIIAYVHMRKMQKKPLWPSNKAERSVPMLDDEDDPMLMASTMSTDT